MVFDEELITIVVEPLGTDSTVEDPGVTNIAVELAAENERLRDSDCDNRSETVDEDRNVRLSSICDDPG